MTPWKQKIAALKADGLTNKEIGSKLNLSPNTIKEHLRQVYMELDVNNAAKLAKKLRELIVQTY